MPDSHSFNPHLRPCSLAACGARQRGRATVKHGVGQRTIMSSRTNLQIVDELSGVSDLRRRVRGVSREIVLYAARTQPRPHTSCVLAGGTWRSTELGIASR